MGCCQNLLLVAPTGGVPGACHRICPKLHIQTLPLQLQQVKACSSHWQNIPRPVGCSLQKWRLLEFRCGEEIVQTEISFTSDDMAVSS